jgi:guanylate kinase
MIEQPNVSPLVLVISGPSGVGKDAVIAGIKQTGLRCHHVITATTRDKRPGETEGIDYFFLSRPEFERRLSAGEFLENAVVYGNYYGVLKSEVSGALAKGEDVIIKVDVQGAVTLKNKMQWAVLVFLAPPSARELQDRIVKRNTDKESDVGHRLGMLGQEMNCLPVFDYAVVNEKDDLARTVETIMAIMKAERHRVGRKVVSL